MDWSIQQIAKLAGTTSRTLRHYHDVGLLTPARIGSNGYRYYDDAALVRLQRILLLRELGLGIPAIAEALTKQAHPADALRTHLSWLRQEQGRLSRQIASVEGTIDALEGGEQLMAENMFSGFDHTQYQDEVEQRWGKEAYARGDHWWSAKSDAEKAEWQRKASELTADWAAAAAAGMAPDGEQGQALAQRQFDWLAGIPGTPGAENGGPAKEYFLGLGQMYVDDPRFGANYGGRQGAEFVRDAMEVFADRNL